MIGSDPGARDARHLDGVLRGRDRRNPPIEPTSIQNMAALPSDAIRNNRVASAGTALSPTTTGKRTRCGAIKRTVPAILFGQFRSVSSHKPAAALKTVHNHHSCLG